MDKKILAIIIVVILIAIYVFYFRPSTKKSKMTNSKKKKKLPKLKLGKKKKDDDPEDEDEDEDEDETSKSLAKKLYKAFHKKFARNDVELSDFNDLTESKINEVVYTELMQLYNSVEEKDQDPDKYITEKDYEAIIRDHIEK